MHGIMIYRVSSMYTHDQKILRILIAAFATELLSVPIIQLVGWLDGSNVNTADVYGEAPVGFCAKEKITSWEFVVWIPIVSFELLICGLALALGIKYYLAVGNHRMFLDYRNSNRETSLLYILLRDSIIFPIIFALVGILNLSVFFLTATKLRHDIVHITLLFPVILSAIFGSRLILNLRESYYEPYDQEFSIRVDTLMDSESNRTSLHLPTTLLSDPIRSKLIASSAVDS
ncbi:hypothetical protein BJ912DRAFT_118317 [Pholiota molesta]|nr:hypothetical protein BJ912DRAFT_118317 [Pholiota molesta]